MAFCTTSAEVRMMRRVNVVFVVLVVGAVLSGVVAAAGFGADLRTIETISVIEDQVGTEVGELRITDQELRVTVRITNPTGFELSLQGTFVRVFQGSPKQIAYGAGQRIDDRGARIPERGALTATYGVSLSPDQAEAVRQAFKRGPVRLTIFHSLSLRDESFEIARTNVTMTGEVGT